MSDTDLGDPAATGHGGLTADPPETPIGLWVRATVHLPKLPRDHLAYVDPTDPQVADALRATWLVPLPGQHWQELPGIDPEVANHPQS